MSSVGIFDSGVGGLTVVRAVRAALPDVSIHYLGDTARVPYGSKSPRTVERYSLACLQFLLERDVELIMVACNTASANALPALEAGGADTRDRRGLARRPLGDRRERDSPNRSSRDARERCGRGPTKPRSPRWRPRRSWCPWRARCWCPSPRRAGPTATWRARSAIATSQQLFELDPAIDTLVLGCTHYPLLKDTIAEVAAEIAGRPITAVDSATAMATEAVEHELDAGDGELHCYVTDATRLDELAERFLGSSIRGVELVDL